jgi:hypothetical protein
VFVSTGRAGIPNVAVVFTDGVPNYSPYTKNSDCLPSVAEVTATQTAAANLKAANGGVTVISIAVGIGESYVDCDTSWNSWNTSPVTPADVVKSIASSPDQYVPLTSFSQLDKVVGLISGLACPQT